jgi:hypothetical protein
VNRARHAPMAHRMPMARRAKTAAATTATATGTVGRAMAAAEMAVVIRANNFSLFF